MKKCIAAGIIFITLIMTACGSGNTDVSNRQDVGSATLQAVSIETVNNEQYSGEESTDGVDTTETSEVSPESYTENVSEKIIDDFSFDNYTGTSVSGYVNRENGKNVLHLTCEIGGLIVYGVSEVQVKTISKDIILTDKETEELKDRIENLDMKAGQMELCNLLAESAQDGKLHLSN